MKPQLGNIGEARVLSEFEIGIPLSSIWNGNDCRV